MSRLRWVIWKELLHVRRDLRTLYLALGMPIILLVIFGYALTFDLRTVPVGVVDQDQTAASRSLVWALQNAGYFEMREIHAPNLQDLVRARYMAILVIPHHFSRDLTRGTPANVQLILDGMDDNTGRLVLGTLRQIIEAWGARHVRLLTRTTKTLSEPSIQVWFNPEMRSQPFIVSGLIAIIMMVISALLTTLTISKEWETQTLTQLLLTPLRPWEIVLGKMVPYMILALVDLGNILWIGHWLFDVPIRGNLITLFIVAWIFVVAGLGIGLLMSTIAQNQRLAMQMTWLVTILPAFLLSGFVFPIENMPWILQALSALVPARYFLVMLRGILFKGATWSDFPMEFLFLTLLSSLLIFSSIRIFIRRTVRHA